MESTFVHLGGAGMAAETKALDLCKNRIDSHRSFVLQGGAGSGKTESLKELLLYIKQTQPQARVVCITHTNAAVAEIVGRVGDKYPISTIHSFLHGLIGDYRKNIKTVIPELFYVPLMVRGARTEDISESDYKKAEHEKYKKVYGKYAKKLYNICKENSEKVVGKREYDKNPVLYNHLLNARIQALNERILSVISEKDYSKIIYNETKFDNLGDLSYGHDGLLRLFHLLFTKYPMLGKIISDKYDYLFIDEYQDTHADILSDLLNLSSKGSLTIGLFGDNMQSIYDDGIGSLDAYVKDDFLDVIPKADNYRCSYEVIKFINPLRLDSITQDVAFKKLDNDKYETAADRHGITKVLYSVIDRKPTAFSSSEDKAHFQVIINHLISEAQKIDSSSKILVLTNKAIAEKNNFKQLYKVFDDRYSDVSDRIEDYLRSIQALDVSDLCQLFIKGEFNELIRLVRKGGYIIHTVSDKKKLHDIMKEIIANTNYSVYEAVELAIYYKLIKRTETYSNISAANTNFLEQRNTDEIYQKFKTLYENGQNTFSRMKDSLILSSEEEFDSYESLWKRERFIMELFSPQIKFAEVLNYAKYLDEGTNYITMHKTKGTSIPSVIVVMEEYFWNEYDFSLLYKPDARKIEKQINSQKLIYVACSRAKSNLICLRIITRDELDHFLSVFPQAEEIQFSEEEYNGKSGEASLCS